MAQVARELQDLGGGLFAWTQLPGSWGWSNAGLITDGEESLLVDTLFDLKLTAEMLTAMRDASPATERIGTVVNTHGNGDHCYGNGILPDADIIATPGCVEDLREAPPSRNALLLRAGAVAKHLGPLARGLGSALAVLGLNRLQLLLEALPLAENFEAFEFAGNEVRLPNRTFTGQLELVVGERKVLLLELGPAHTKGDAIVIVPDARVVFTGDLLFHEAHPVVWEGPVSNWVDALRRMLELDVDTVVPGHGPITDKSGLTQQLEYLETLTERARAHWEAGQSVEEAAREIHRDFFPGRLDRHRVFVNVHTLYRDFRGDRQMPDILEMFAGMARLARHE